jgi:metalloendopeptidase OMA1, mitochondrial
MRLPRHAYGHKTRSSGLGGLLRSRFSLILVGLFLVFLYWQANQTEVPFSGRKQLNTVSIEKEVQLGQQSYVQILNQEQQNGNDVLCADGNNCDGTEAEYTRAVREIGVRLQRAAVELEQDLLRQGASFTPVADQFDWTYYVVDSDTPNAFCLPGGYVAIYTGILDITGNYDGKVGEDDISDLDKLAVVMGHEIGHALAHHGAERVSQQRVVQFGQIAVGVGLGDMDASQQRAIMPIPANMRLKPTRSGSICWYALATIRAKRRISGSGWARSAAANAHRNGCPLTQRPKHGLRISGNGCPMP